MRRPSWVVWKMLAIANGASALVTFALLVITRSDSFDKWTIGVLQFGLTLACWSHAGETRCIDAIEAHFCKEK